MTGGCRKAGRRSAPPPNRLIVPNGGSVGNRRKGGPEGPLHQPSVEPYERRAVSRFLRSAFVQRREDAGRADGQAIRTADRNARPTRMTRCLFHAPPKTADWIVFDSSKKSRPRLATLRAKKA